MNDNDKPVFDDTRMIGAIWIALMATGLLLRPLLPIDETRYLTVAWEMHLGGQYLVPHLNGELYSHKPPLLFWLINLGWAVFGASEAWARMVAPLFGLGALILTAKMARALWPEAAADTLKTRSAIAPLMLVAGGYWAIFSTLTMFDMMLTFSALVGLLGVLRAWRGFAEGPDGRGAFWRGVALAGLGLGLGGLSKGPAIMLHILPAFALAPLWGPRLTGLVEKRGWGLWYAGLLASVLIGFALALAWAIPAAIAGGEEYRNAIFLGQSTGRMVNSFAHNRPFWWFLAIVPALVFPWSLWPRIWRGFGFVQAWREERGIRGALHDGGVRFLFIWFGFAFVAFSAISGKQPHYLLPEFPALALIVAYLLSRKDAGEPSEKGRGHLIPVLFLCALAAIGASLPLWFPWAEPHIKNVPDWAGMIEPLWLVPALVLTAAAALMRAHTVRAEARLIALSLVSLIVFLGMAASPGLRYSFDLKPSASLIAGWQAEGRPIAYIGKYHGEFQYLGRLEEPLAVFDGPAEARVWAKANPTGIVIDNTRMNPGANQAIYVRAYRGKYLMMWEAAAFVRLNP